ncbi:hypothetical protein AB0B56_09980 [Streptosporangium canum]|uniref:hypothetical protein n=1 Tax=Streptosporangium canum TaxID=324952 RepID=UPI0034299809
MLKMANIALWKDLSGYLKITSKVIEKVGAEINVGERFALEVTGSNTAPAGDGLPVIVFNRPRIKVRGTENATPTTGNGWHPMPATVLKPGESTSMKIEMNAIGEVSKGIFDNFTKEVVASVVIRGDLDQDQFFQIDSAAVELKEEIEAG